MAEEEERKVREKKLLKIEILLKRVTNALYLGNYRQAEKLCHELLEEDPENPLATKLLYWSIQGRHALTQTQIIKDKEEHYDRSWEEIAEAKVPYQDYVRFPDKDLWINLIDKRLHGVAPEIE